MTRLVAIHQPNFFPWAGYFDKIRRSSHFVFLDAVDYPRTGAGTWCNRVRLNIQSEARWITCPVQRMPFGAPILSASIDDAQPWRTKLLKTLDANYCKAPRYRETMDLIEPLIRHGEQNLAAFNIAAITGIARHLGLETPLLRQSEMLHEGNSTRLLMSLVKSAGGDAYLAGGGAAGYQEDHLFDEAGMKLVYQDFKPQPYGDPSRFLPGLSIIDYLMHDGRKLTEAVDGK